MDILTFEEAQAELDKIAEQIPPEVYHDLNGGIILLPDEVISPHSVGSDLYTLGMYHFDPRGLGRYITIHYGSLCRIWAGMNKDRQIDKLREVLHHELVHHLEHKAGDRTLERQDETDLEEYRRGKD